MELKKLFYDYHYCNSFGGGGYWLINKQKIFNFLISLVIIILLILFIIK